MYGKAPVSILTDQDLAIGAAVKKVFPDSRHHLCLWHIKKKFPEKLSHLYHKKSAFKCGLNKCIYESYTVEEFEKVWNELIIENGLEQNEWLQGLYEIRNS
ncbi:hypothetical protein V6N11_079500 [Hibiscus sabdariffa]|uniref:Protein FAR1-RELATED SEQUENCE n=1 Tax=Hibiscus sabdariffa TaxID=183260 RepID=A0ABR2RVV3_9ROSI